MSSWYCPEVMGCNLYIYKYLQLHSEFANNSIEPTYHEHLLLCRQWPTSALSDFVIITMLSGELIVSRYVAESITTDAGRFGQVGLCQLRTCTQLAKAYLAKMWPTWPTWPKRPASVVIDSATYLLMISSPDIDNVAMSLYNIITMLVV